MKKIASFMLVISAILSMLVATSHALTAADEKKLSNGLDQHLWSRVNANMDFIRMNVNRETSKVEALMLRNAIKNVIQALSLLGNNKEVNVIHSDEVCIKNIAQVDLPAVEKDLLSVDDALKVGADFENANVQQYIANILVQFDKALCQKD